MGVTLQGSPQICGIVQGRSNINHLFGLGCQVVATENVSEVAVSDDFLIVESDEGIHRRISLELLPHTLGRVGFADTGFSTQYVSRRHVEIYRIGQEVHVRDLGSRNGTYVNGQPVSEVGVAISPGDLVVLGKGLVSLRYVHDEHTLSQAEIKESKGNVSIDVGRRDVAVEGQLITPPLGFKEFEILAFLVNNAGNFCQQNEIARVGWPERGGDVGDEEVRQIIRRLRQRIDLRASGHSLIENRRGSGYRLLN